MELSVEILQVENAIVVLQERFRFSGTYVFYCCILISLELMSLELMSLEPMYILYNDFWIWCELAKIEIEK